MKNYQEAKDAFEFRYLIQLLKKSGGWKSKASLISGISRMQLDRMMERHGITIADDEKIEEEKKNAIG